MSVDRGPTLIMVISRDVQRRASEARFRPPKPTTPIPLECPSMYNICRPEECVGQDLNLRTPTGQDPEPCAFDQAWQPTHAAVRREFHGFVRTFL